MLTCQPESLPSQQQSLHPETGQPKRTGHPKAKAAFTQAVAMQRVLYDEAMSDEVKPLERSSLARVWCELEETKRKLKMKPLPKPIDVSKAPRRSKQPQVPFKDD